MNDVASGFDFAIGIILALIVVGLAAIGLIALLRKGYGERTLTFVRRNRRMCIHVVAATAFMFGTAYAIASFQAEQCKGLAQGEVMTHAQERLAAIAELEECRLTKSYKDFRSAQRAAEAKKYSTTAFTSSEKEHERFEFMMGGDERSPCYLAFNKIKTAENERSGFCHREPQWWYDLTDLF